MFGPMVPSISDPISGSASSEFGLPPDETLCNTMVVLLESPPMVKQETPPSTPRSGKIDAEKTQITPRSGKLQETPVSTPRHGKNGLKMPCFDTPPPLTLLSSPTRKKQALQTDLEDAIGENSMELLEMALNRQILEWGSLIHACVEGEHASALQFVLENGMIDSINEPSSSTGQRPIEWAMAMHGRRSVPMMRLLLQFGADPKVVCTGGKSLLHKAAAGMNAPAVELLLEYGANPRHVDDNSCTPLHELSKTAGRGALFRPPPEYYSIAETLQASGVDPEHRNAAGALAQDYIPPWWTHSHAYRAGSTPGERRRER